MKLPLGSWISSFSEACLLACQETTSSNRDLVVPSESLGEQWQFKKGRRTSWGKVLFGAVTYSESAVHWTYLELSLQKVSKAFEIQQNLIEVLSRNLKERKNHSKHGRQSCPTSKSWPHSHLGTRRAQKWRQLSLVKGMLQNLVLLKTFPDFRFLAVSPPHPFFNLEEGLLQLVSKLWIYSYFSTTSESLFYCCSYWSSSEMEKCGIRNKTTAFYFLLPCTPSSYR